MTDWSSCVSSRNACPYLQDTLWVEENGRTLIGQLILPKAMKTNLQKNPGFRLEKRIGP